MGGGERVSTAQCFSQAGILFPRVLKQTIKDQLKINAIVHVERKCCIYAPVLRNDAGE